MKDERVRRKLLHYLAADKIDVEVAELQSDRATKGYENNHRSPNSIPVRAAA